MLFLYPIIITIIISFYIQLNVISIIILSFVFSKILIKILESPPFSLEIASSVDALLNYEITSNRSHIVGCCILDSQMSSSIIISQIIQRAFCHTHYNKLKKLFRRKYGIGYWTFQKDFNINNHLEILENNFKGYDDLYEFISLHTHESMFSEELPKWKIFIGNIDKKTVLIMKIHHAIGDGLSVMSYIFQLGNCENLKLIEMKKTKGFINIKGLLQDFTKVLAFIWGLFVNRKDKNNYNQKKLIGKKIGFRSKTMDLERVKNYAKLKNVGLNDVLVSLLWKSIENLHIKIFNKEYETLRLMVAASIRSLPTDNRPTPLINHVNFLTLQFESIHNVSFDQRIKIAHQKILNLKSPSLILFQYLAGELSYYFTPLIISHFFINRVTTTHSIIFTNVPGPLEKIKLFGSNVDEIFFLANAMGELSNVINIFSYNGKFNIGCLNDECLEFKPKEFIQEFERIYEEIL